ncbi:MAG TPA: CvpA family protein [Melioribacteraceae bacterium]|nr:CvpA family protein [Melioribacteraceae bacterium]
MNYIDIVIFIAAVIGFLLGFKDGLIRKIIGLIGLIAAIAFAFEFSDNFGQLLNPIFNRDEYFSTVVAGIIIFLVTILVASIIKRIVHPVDKLNKFLNQFVGGLIGTVQIIFFLSGMFLFLNIFSFPDKKTASDSLLYNHIYNLIPSSIDLIIGHRAKASDFIKSIIEDKDKISTPPVDSLN